MGKAEERCRMDRVVICEESLICFDGMPVVIGDKSMAPGLFFIDKLRCLEYDYSSISVYIFRNTGTR